MTTEANPDSVTPESLAALREGGFTRVSFGMQSAVAARAAGARADARPGAGGAGRASGRGRPGFEQVSLDLIYGTPGEIARGLAGLGRGGAGLRAGPRLGVLADRGGRHPAGPPGAHRRDPGAGRRRPRGQVRAGRRRCSPRPGWTWYEVSNWARDEAARCRHNELYWTQRQLVGGRPGRALPRRRRALVERQAPQRVRRPHHRRRVARPGRRDARRRDPRDGAGAAGGPAVATGSRSTSCPRPTPASTRSSSAASPSSRATASSSPAAAACSPTPWCASWWGDGFPGRPGKPAAGGQCNTRQPPELPAHPARFVFASTMVDTSLGRQPTLTA